MLDRGRSLRAAAQAVGLTHTTVSRALEQGRLRAPNRPVPEPHGSRRSLWASRKGFARRRRGAKGTARGERTKQTGGGAQERPDPGRWCPGPSLLERPTSSGTTG